MFIKLKTLVSLLTSSYFDCYRNNNFKQYQIVLSRNQFMENVLAHFLML